MKCLFILFLLIAVLTGGCSKLEEEIEPIVVVQSVDTIIASIFPNPTKGDITITFDEVYSEVKIELINVQGTLFESIIVKNRGKAEMYIEEKGLFILRLTHIDGAVLILKVIRE